MAAGVAVTLIIFSVNVLIRWRVTYETGPSRGRVVTGGVIRRLSSSP